MNDMTETFTPYDRADYLGILEEAAAYLEAALEEPGDDPSVGTQALGTIAFSGNISVRSCPDTGASGWMSGVTLWS